MQLNPLQHEFTKYVAQLIQFMYDEGYSCSFGDAARYDCKGHTYYSWHYVGLAVDLNLFKDGHYLTTTNDHRKFGDFWKSRSPFCTWGGDFSDGNHYSYGESANLTVYAGIKNKIRQMHQNSTIKED